MFGVGLPEMAVIAFIAVLVFGPDRLPDLARQAGQMIRKARDFANSARDELRFDPRPFAVGVPGRARRAVDRAELRRRSGPSSDYCQCSQCATDAQAKQLHVSHGSLPC